MLLSIRAGTTSKRIPVFIADSSSTTGAGKTGLAFDTASLVWYYWREDAGNVAGTAVTLATATLGTFTSGGFKEKDSTNMPGDYELGIPDAALAAGAKWVKMMLKGATNMAPLPILIELTSAEPDGSLDAGTAAAIANGTITLRSGHGLASSNSFLVVLTGGTNAFAKSRIMAYSGTGDVFNVDPAWNANGETLPSGTITYAVYPLPPNAATTIPGVNVTQWNSAALATPATAGVPVVDAKYLTGTLLTARDIGASVLISEGTGTGQLDSTSGVVKANLAQILGTALTETAGQIAAAFKKFFDKATPTGTINSLPDAVAGAAGGVFIAGTNAATTVTTALTTTFTGNLTGSVGSLGATAKTDVNAEVVDALATDTYAEVSAVPAATSTIVAKINWLFIKARNKLTQTATAQVVKADDGTTTVATAAVSDDGTTATRSEFV